MLHLTKEETEGIATLLSLTDEGDLTLLQEILKLRQSLEETENRLFEALSMVEKGSKGDKGDKGEKGDKGDRGTRGQKGDKGDKPVAGVDFPLPKNGRDGLDGENPNPKDIVPLVLKELPEAEVTKDDKEELLESIKRLEEELKKIRQAPLVSFGGRLGGGNSDSNVRFSLGRVIKKETPVGAINGSNTVYTVSQDIHAVISFVINGEAITDDTYTTSAKTITFTDPLPADLSGTSFRIVYA